MKKKHLKFLKQLVETPSPTGFEEPAASLVRERLADVADEVATDTMGSVRAVLEGRDFPSAVIEIKIKFKYII